MSTNMLSRASNFRDYSQPLKSYELDSEAYFLAIAKLPGLYATSVSAPLNSINLFDTTTLQTIGKLPGHDVAITSLHAIPAIGNLAGPTLMSSGRDGNVRIWDSRSNSVGIQMNDSKPLLCCDVSSNGFTVVAGGELLGNDAELLFWDPRQPAAPLRKHTSTHSDDITAVSFAPASSGLSSNTVLSGSVDGLVSLTNSEEDDEDEAVTQVGNWGCSIAQLGWTGKKTGPSIWASSDMETFSTWSNELDQIQSQDIRNPTLHGEQTWVTDYLISCSTSGSPRFSVFVGSNEGDVALLSNTNLSSSESPWMLHNTWSTGHIGVVRSLLLDMENNAVVTGGEDAKLHVWRASEETGGDMEVDSHSSSRRKRSLDNGEDKEGKRVRH